MACGLEMYMTDDWRPGVIEKVDVATNSRGKVIIYQGGRAVDVTRKSFHLFSSEHAAMTHIAEAGQVQP